MIVVRMVSLTLTLAYCLNAPVFGVFLCGAIAKEIAELDTRGFYAWWTVIAVGIKALFLVSGTETL